MVKDLEMFFESVTLPDGTFMLNDHTKILDLKKFVASHLAFINANNGAIMQPYVDRLNELKKFLENN